MGLSRGAGAAGGAGFVHSSFPSPPRSPGSVGLGSHPPGIPGSAALGDQAQRLPKSASAQRSRKLQARSPRGCAGAGRSPPAPCLRLEAAAFGRTGSNGWRPCPCNFHLPSEPQRRRGLRTTPAPARSRRRVRDQADANPKQRPTRLQAEGLNLPSQEPQLTAERLGGLE